MSEEYNDNVFLTPKNRAIYSITRLAPSITYAYKASLWDWDLHYTYDYRHYTEIRREISDNLATDEKLHNAKTQIIHAKQQTRIVDNFFIVDVKDDYERVSKDVTRDFTQESNIVNQTDRNVVNVKPHFIFRPSSNTTLNVGYTLVDTWYKDPVSIDTIEHVGYGEIVLESSPKTAINTGVRYSRNVNSVLEYTKGEVYVGPKFEYAEGSLISVNVGYDRLDFDNGIETGQVFWDIQAVRKYPTISASFETGVRYIPDPKRVVRREDRYLASLSKETERTSLKVSGGVSQYLDAERNYLETTNYSVNGIFSHRVAEKTKITYSLSISRVENNVTDTYTNRYITDVRLEQSPFENMLWAIEYRYTDAYSPDSYSANYLNSRVIVEITKKF